MTRIIGGNAGGRRIETPRRPAHASHRGPGAGGAVQCDRVVVRLAAGAEVPRPVRRLRSGRARGLVARGGRGQPRRVRPAHRAAHLRERQAAGLLAGPRGHQRGRGGAVPAAVGAVRRRLHGSAVPPRGRQRGRGARAAPRPGVAGAGRHGRRRAVVAEPRTGLAGGLHRHPGAEVRRDDALVRSRRRRATPPKRGRADAPSGLPQAPSTRSRAGTSTSSAAPRRCSTRSSSRSASTRPRTGCSGPRSASRCSRRAWPTSPTSGSPASPA